MNTENTPLTLDELYEEFEFLGEWEDQCRYLIEIGEQLTDLPNAEKSDANRVLGCQARVWLVPTTIDSDRIAFRAKSDARLVDGLIVIVSLLFSGKSAREILDTDVTGPFKRLGLESHLVPQRRNGLYAMVERVRSLARIALGATVASPPIEPTSSSSVAEAIPQRGIAPGEKWSQVEALPETSFAAFDIEAIRSQFPALQQFNSAGRRIVYLDSASSSQKPQMVIDKEREVYEEYYANAYRGVYRFGDRVSTELESVRGQAAKFIGASSPDEIIFTTGTTMGMNLIANAWGRKFLQPGDEILLNLVEHHANIVPWQWVASQTGAVVRFAGLLPDGSLDLDDFDRMVNARTRVVSVTGLSNVLGTITPLEHVGARARDVGALLVVDAAQSIPHLPIDVVAQHVDYLAFSGHKLYGPSGIGISYGRRELLESMDPFLCGGHMISRVGLDGFETSSVPAKFEAGTLPIAQAIALGAAFKFVESLGLKAMHAHEQQLFAYATQRLADVPGLRIYGPATLDRGAIISFTMDGAAAQDLASLLDVHAVCVRHGHHCTMPLHDWLGVPATVRASIGVYNTTSDIDALADGLNAARKILKLQ